MRRGFTLVELLIYISITSIALVVFTNFMANTTASAGRLRQGQELQANMNLVFERMAQEVRSAQGIDPATVYADPGTLVLATASGNHTFSVVNGALTLNTGTSVSLTSNKLTVTSFQLQNTAPGVTMKITLQGNGAPAQTVTASTTLIPHATLYQ